MEVREGLVKKGAECDDNDVVAYDRFCPGVFENSYMLA